MCHFCRRQLYGEANGSATALQRRQGGASNLERRVLCPFAVPISTHRTLTFVQTCPEVCEAGASQHLYMADRAGHVFFMPVLQRETEAWSAVALLVIRKRVLRGWGESWHQSGSGLSPEMCFDMKNIFPVLVGVMLG